MTFVHETAENDPSSVSVAVRIRPQSAKEKLTMSHICTTVDHDTPQVTLGKDYSFTFDYVFNMHSPQEQVFQFLAKPLIDGCLNGYNATILAYGQTGSGKTYTMGTGVDPGFGNLEAGIIPRAVQYLFNQISQCRSEAAMRREPVPEFKVVAQFLELYNEELIDLLDSNRSRKSHLRLHENAQGDIYLTGVSTRLVSSLNDTLKCLRDGSLLRSTASTNMNTQSSRSHAIFTLHIRRHCLVKYTGDTVDSKPDDQTVADQAPDSAVVDPVPEFETLTAKFHFVDLAGSERLKRTGATGDRAKEGISINRGLLSLGNVISALGDKAKRGCHVPYRDSKLTRLLQDSLGGNSRTIMIACISPSDCDFVETLNTLKYANRARNIKNRVVMNQDKTSKQLATLRAQVAALQEEVEEYRQGKRMATSIGADGVSDLSKELAFWRAENERLQLRVKALIVTIDTIKTHNARLMADNEASAWAASKLRLLQSAHNDNTSDCNSTDHHEQRSALNLVVEEADSFRQLVERYTIENEELRTKLAEVEALAEFGQRPFTLASPCHPSRYPGASSSSNRVALTNGEFPDLDTSMVAAAEAGLSAANLYFDENGEAELFVPQKPRRKHRKKKCGTEKITKPYLNHRLLNDLAPSDLPSESWLSSGGENKKQRLNPAPVIEPNSTLVGQSEEAAGSEHSKINGTGFEDGVRSPSSDADESYIDLASENGDGGTPDDTILPDPAGDETLTHTLRKNSDLGSGSDTYSDASDAGSSSSSSGSATDEKGATVKRVTNETEAKLHKSLAKLSSQIDSKQHLLAELQFKAAQLEQLRKHYEQQLADLNNRIRETERERDKVLASMGQLEHIGEERLRRTREEFEKKLSSLQDEVKNLQRSRQEQGRLEREQTRKNEQLRLLRTELEDLRRYKIELTKRLQQETKRTRQLETVTTKRVLELKRAKSQADSQIRSLEAAHSAKERALRQKQAELDALRRKAQEQQRQLSSGSSRMTQSFMGSTGSSTAKTSKAISGGAMSTSLFAGSATPNRPTTGVHGRIMASAKAKWALIAQQLELDVQRCQTSARLELDLKTWLRERECLGRRLQRLQRRRTRLEESIVDDPDHEDITPRLDVLDEQIRNVTAQLESVQEAINECQASIIELDKSSSKSTTSLSKTACLPSTTACTLFSNCTLSESRFLLDQLYTHLISYKLQANRLHQSESQSRNNLAAWKQEREHEFEVLRLTMQHAGLPLDIVDNVLSMATIANHSDKSTALCPHHGSASVTGCELCSLSGIPSSAPLSSEDSSEEAGQMESCTSLSNKNVLPSTSMSQSLYGSLDCSSSRKPLRRNLSETDEPGSDRINSGNDLPPQSIKARVRMLLPQDMLGLSVSQTSSNFGSSPASELMPAPGSCFLRRPRTALGNPTAAAAPPSEISRNCMPSLSTGPSPVVRRRFPGPSSHVFQANSVNSTATRHGLPLIHSALPVLGTTASEPHDTTSSASMDNKSCQFVANPADEDVFNRLTCGISSSPHPSRGSIQQLQRSVTLLSGPLVGAQIVQSPSSHPYRIVSSATVSTGILSSEGIEQPLAAFFNNSCTPVTSTHVTQESTSAPLVVSTAENWSSTAQLPGFRVPMECTHVARGHSNGVLDVDILGDLMVTGSKDRTAKVWDLKTMEEVDTLKDHPNNVSKVRICPVTDLIFTVCSYFIKVWDRRDSRKCIRTLLSSGLSQDGELEMKITRRQNICPPGETSIMDIALGGPHSSLTHSMFLATANSVKLWDLRRYYCVGKLHGGHQAPVMVLAAGQIPAYSSPAKPLLTVVTGSKDHYIKVFNVSPNSSGLLTPTFDLEPPHYDGIESLALHGNTLFSGSRDAAIKKWNLSRTGRQEVMLAQAHKDWIQGLAVTSDGMNLISGCRGGTLKLWNVEDCVCLGELLNAHEGPINSVRVCSDRIFTAGSDKDVRFWRLLDPARC